MISKAISHYRILEKIGKGGMGVVYKAEDKKLKRTVALKFLPSELTQNQESKERFIREAQAAAALNHPHICIIHEIDESEGQTFIAMEYIEGQSLMEKIMSGPLKTDESIEIAVQIAEGLKVAHEKGIIHRDIKPANIMLTENGQAKIMDFGLAKLEWEVDLTKTAIIMGTAAYMSPEQARGEKVDHRTDIWSFGALLYEMFTGIPPFKSGQIQSVIYSILNENPLPITKLRKDIPMELEHVIQKSLKKESLNRYKDIGELILELKSIDTKPEPKPSSSKSTEEESSIAVLPFVNLSAEPENEYFSDGLTEELINALTKIKGLHVVARTSSFAFKGEKIDIREVGQKLNVKTLLEGSVRKAGKNLRITAQLINVTDGYHLWSERYDRELEDVFAIQDEITERIVDKLKADLAILDERQKDYRSSNLEAYDLYLKGRYYWHRFSPEKLDKIISYYEQAIEKEPKFALAYAALAEIYVFLSIGFAILPSKEIMPKAREAAQKALQLDPTLAEAHGALGLIATCYDWDRKAAKKSFERAIELNPNSASAHMWIEIYLTFLEGKFDEAIAELERARELDPLNLLIEVRLGYMYYYLRDFDRAIAQFKKIVDLEPTFAIAHHGLMDTYGQKGMFDEAIEEGELGRKLGAQAIANIGVLGFYYALAGKKAEANKHLADLEELSKKGYMSSFWIGVIYHGLGETDKAFERFNKAYEERDGNLIYITIPPPFDSLRVDSRFKQLLKKMGLENLLEKHLSK